MKLLDSKNYGLKIYNRFPNTYIEEDSRYKYALKRYLQSIGEGGFDPAIEDINKLTSLIDPNLMPKEVLPLLFQYLGVEIFNGIPEQYLRQLLPYVGTLCESKGSIDVIEYLSSAVSGTKTSATISYGDTNNTILSVALEMDYSLGDVFLDAGQLRRLLEKFAPFYCDVAITYLYMFEDTVSLHMGEEEDITNITDTKLESGQLFSTDNTLNKWVTSIIESNSLSVSEILGDKVSSVSNEICSEAMSEECYSILKTPTEHNAVFGLGVMGKAVFGNNTFNEVRVVN